MSRFAPSAIALLVIFFSIPGGSCAPEFASVSFVNAHGPDAPIADFAAGRIGVVQTSWWRAPLVVSYLYFSGKPLTRAEQQSFAEYWNPAGYLPPQPKIPLSEQWVKARGQYRSAPPSGNVDAYSARGGPVEYQNCLGNAFTTAIATLRARAQTWGAQSPDLHEWINGQDAVFSNCSRSGSLPQSLPASANALLRADRAYQIAAAYFYAGEFNRAIQLFDAVARDAKSPWRHIAALVAARAKIRSATLAENNPNDVKSANNKPDLEDAASRLRAILADPSLREVHADATRLLGFVEFRLNPDLRLRQITREFVERTSGANFALQLRDFDLLLDQPGLPPITASAEQAPREHLRNVGLAIVNPSCPSCETASKPARNSDATADLTDWVRTMQMGGPIPAKHALQRWNTTHSLPWLIAALAFSQPNTVDRELLTASAQIEKTSSAYLTVAYHRARLLRARGEAAAARQLLDAALSDRAVLPVSALNLLLDERMRVAATEGEFLGLLARKPFVTHPIWDYYPDDRETPLCFDAGCYKVFYSPDKQRLLPQFGVASARTLNTRVPLSVLVAASTSDAVPANLRRRLATATWTRAALLDETAAANSLAATVTAVDPEMRPYVAAVQDAKSPEARRFAVAFTIVHFPGLHPYVDDGEPRTTAFDRIDDYRNNWWCYELGAFPSAADYVGQSVNEHPNRPFRLAEPYPAFLDPTGRKQADEQWKALQKFGDSADALAREIVIYARTHLRDPRVPEALHLSVRATRYSCSATVYVYGQKKPVPNYSREAYTLLHHNFPKSEWARETPYWF